MAAKTKSKGFSRFLDFIGLVDSDEDDVFEHKQGMDFLEPGETAVYSFTMLPL